MPNLPGGMPAMPTHVAEVCSARRGDAAPVPLHDGRCQVSDVQRTGDRQSMNLHCEGPRSFDGRLELVYDTPDHYQGQMPINPGQGGVRTRPGMGPVILRMEGQRIGVCDPGSGTPDPGQSSGPSQPGPHLTTSCGQSAASLEYWAFLGAQPSCTDADSVHSFCSAIQDFDGFLRLGSHEADDEATLAALPAARRAAMMHPLTAAAGLCSFRIPEIRLRLCSGAEAAGQFAFLGSQCPDEARTLARRVCTAADSATAPGPYREFCAGYLARRKNPGEK